MTSNKKAGQTNQLWSTGAFLICASWPIGSVLAYFIMKYLEFSFEATILAPIPIGFVIYCVLALVFKNKV